jgi:hypothetical protein
VFTDPAKSWDEAYFDGEIKAQRGIGNKVPAVRSSRQVQLLARSWNGELAGKPTSQAVGEVALCINERRLTVGDTGASGKTAMN